VTRSFLGRSIGYGGAVPLDPSVATAVRYRLPFTLAAPDAAATRAVRDIARRLVGTEDAASARRGRSFFSRVAGWLSGAGASHDELADSAEDRRSSGR